MSVRRYPRECNMRPYERSTENLIRYVVNEAVARSPIPVPQKIVDEFWGFFHELTSEPELRGLGELGLDIARLLLRTYEPLLVEVINVLKDIFYTNQGRECRSELRFGPLGIACKHRPARFVRPPRSTEGCATRLRCATTRFPFGHED
ncbi:MAG TPA: hypothetical protein VET87_22145, partial [Rubrivivax sp.]|nr:hypothetical protein [Rubrivivax sp.]